MSDKKEIIKDALRELDRPTRRLFGRQLLSLGSLSLLSGCRLDENASVEAMLKGMSRFNDRVQAGLFDPSNLAPTYAESMITKPFPFNAFYDMDKAPVVAAESYQLKLSGAVAGKKIWSLPELYALPQTSQITRHICVEGWSAIGKWGGVPFGEFLRRCDADLTQQFIGFRCADGYFTSIDMPTALHSQTLLTFTFADQILPRQYGFPMKLRMPTKLGYKNPKHITEIFLTNSNPGGYWENEGYNWFGGS
jgi:DMSO/TMAO reductase YedYZ molybdopterin-dependent catalytic subunit